MIHFGRQSLGLTLIEELEAAVGATAVCSEQQIQEAATAEQEVGDLSAVQRGDEWREQVRAVMDFQEIVIELGLEPEEERGGEKKRKIRVFLYPVYLISIHPLFNTKGLTNISYPSWQTQDSNHDKS